MTTINQPSAMPTRKMWAVMVAGLLVAGLRVTLGTLYPDIDMGPVIEAVRPIVESALIVAAGYFTKDNAATTGQ